MSQNQNIPTFHLPTKPYNVIDAINRAAAATGSFEYVELHNTADFNGHYNTLVFNDYRQYYVGEYTWAGRRVFTRSRDFAYALQQAKAEYNRQGKGAFLLVVPKDEADVAVCRADADLIEGSDKTENRDWYTWKHEQVGHAVWLMRTYGVPTSLLLDADTEEAWKEATSNNIRGRFSSNKTPTDSRV